MANWTGGDKDNEPNDGFKYYVYFGLVCLAIMLLFFALGQAWAGGWL